MSREPREERPLFAGFDPPESNYFRLPADWIDITASITNIAELKVVQYILRHTWGFQEYGIKKHITIDEFVRGRKRRDGTRMDKGTGLSERAVRYGLADALTHGFIEELVDDADRARIKKYYSLKMRGMSPEPSDDDEPAAAPSRADSRRDLQAEVQTLHPGVQSLPGRGANAAPRTEIETLEKTREILGGGVLRANTQETVSPDTHQVENTEGLAVPTTGVAKLLHEFGISPDVANQLAATYPEDHILHEYDYTCWLLEVHPKRVRDNPAGFLRRAIERAFSPPPEYQTPAEREAAAAARAQAEEDDRRRFAAEQREHARAKELTEQQLAATYPAQPIAGTALTTNDAWDQVLTLLKGQVTGPNFTMWLKPTRLVRCDGDKAVIVAPFVYHAEHLAQRLDPHITQALRTVVGTPVRCRYITLGEAVQPEAAHPTEGSGTGASRADAGGSYAAG